MNKKQSRVMRSFQIKMITRLSQGTFESIDLKNPVFSRWLVGYLVDNNIPFQVVSFGEGVTRIIKSGKTCAYCNGKGFTEMDHTPIENLELPDSDDNAEKKSDCCGEGLNCSEGCKDGGLCCKDKNEAA
ncbi:MAG: hypothetical protein CSA18_03625 [Deltaproteobacteria bacterium]|nr:MAG: hypothetical protein CSA18_03625 [Deltaproteobacteria bacterium]